MDITLIEITLFFVTFILIGGLCDMLLDKMYNLIDLLINKLTK